MGKIFTLDLDTKAIIRDCLDDLITELGKMCRIVYPAVWKNCINCVMDPIGNKSSNIWRTGGPVPFQNTICPLCGGKGKRAEEVTEDIQLLCRWEPKKFFVPVPNVPIRQPFSLLQTKGYLSDLPKIERADHLIFELPIEPIKRMTFRLYGEAGDRSNIIQGRYFVATWERI